MRILFVSQDPDLYLDSFGIEVPGDPYYRHCTYEQIIKKRTNNKSQIIIITYTNKNLEKKVFSKKRIGNLKIIGTNSINRLFYSFDVFKIIMDYRAKGWIPEVVTSQNPWGEAIILLILSKILKFNFIPQIHTDISSKYWLFERPFINIARAISAKIIIKFSKKVRVVSERIAFNISKVYKENLDKFIVAPVGISLTLDSKKYKINLKRNLATKDFNILYIGRFAKEKDLILWVNTALILCKNYSNIKFILIGYGKEKYKVRNLINQSRFAYRFTLFNKVNYKDLPNFYSKSHILLFTSFYEGFGRVVLEAMTFGLPCISTKSGGPEDLIKNNINGFLIGERDPNLIAKKCEEIFLDKDKYELISNNAYKYANNNFNFRILSNKFSQLILDHKKEDKILMISLGNDITTGKGKRTIDRHIKYANFSNVKIYMILLSPISYKLSKKDVIKNNSFFVYPISSKNHFILVIKALNKAIKICLDNDFKMIYTQDPFGTAVIGNILKKLFNIPLLIGNHSSFADNKIWINEKPIYFRFLYFIMKLNLPRADAWRVNNKKEKEIYIKKFKLESKKITVNNTLIDTEIFTKKYDKDELNKIKYSITGDLSTKLIIWAGRPVKVKRIDLLLKTFESILEDVSNTKLIMAGNLLGSKYIDNLLKEFDYKVRKRIYFLDKEADHNYLSKLYKISDVYLHTSSYEGFGAVLAEASLSGLPVVSTKNDGCMDIIENKKSGFIVQSSSNKVIAKYVIKLLKNDSLRKKMGLYGQSRALEKYSVIKNLETRDKLWKNVINIGLGKTEKRLNKNLK